MNRIYILGKIISKDKLHFNYLDKLKVYFSFEIKDLYGNLFRCVVEEKRVEDILGIYNSLKDFAYIVCTQEAGVYYLSDMYVL